MLPIEAREPRPGYQMVIHSNPTGTAMSTNRGSAQPHTTRSITTATLLLAVVLAPLAELVRPRMGREVGDGFVWVATAQQEPAGSPDDVPEVLQIAGGGAPRFPGKARVGDHHPDPDRGGDGGGDPERDHDPPADGGRPGRRHAPHPERSARTMSSAVARMPVAVGWNGNCPDGAVPGGSPPTHGLSGSHTPRSLLAA